MKAIRETKRSLADLVLLFKRAPLSDLDFADKPVILRVADFAVNRQNAAQLKVWRKVGQIPTSFCKPPIDAI